MATQAETLADAVTAANAALIDAVERCSDEGWRRHSAREGRTVGVLAHHVALAYGPIAGMARAVADGHAPALPSQEALDGMNARQAIEAADVSREETLALLRREGAGAAALVGGLSDAQLARTFEGFDGQEWTVARFIEGAVVGHPVQHLASIRAALGS
jgi:uncharacterized damage-inducible protein DinB